MEKALIVCIMEILWSAEECSMEVAFIVWDIEVQMQKLQQHAKMWAFSNKDKMQIPHKEACP